MKAKEHIPINAVLFDFDGTLTLPGAIPFSLIKQEIACPENMPILEYIASIQSPIKARQAAAVLNAHELASARRSQPRPDAEDLIAAIAEQGLPMGILTRNTLASVEEAMQNFKRVTTAVFSALLTRENVARHKPHPEGVFMAAKQLGVPPRHILVVGDYIFDIQAGQAAGAKTAFLDDGTTEPPSPPPDFTVRSLAELKPIILQ